MEPDIPTFLLLSGGYIVLSAFPALLSATLLTTALFVSTLYIAALTALSVYASRPASTFIPLAVGHMTLSVEAAVVIPGNAEYRSGNGAPSNNTPRTVIGP